MDIKVSRKLFLCIYKIGAKKVAKKVISSLKDRTKYFR